MTCSLLLAMLMSNRVRENKFNQAKNKGYHLVNYVSSKATVWPDLSIGENCFILEDNTIQPFVTIGDNVTLWSGNHIGHHARINSNCFISSHVVISGGVVIGKNCFLGVNATTNDHISIGDNCIIGSGAIVTKSTSSNGVYVETRQNYLKHWKSHNFLHKVSYAVEKNRVDILPKQSL